MKVPVLLEELLLSAATANGALYPIKIWIMWSCLIDSTIVAFCSMIDIESKQQGQEKSWMQINKEEWK